MRHMCSIYTVATRGEWTVDFLPKRRLKERPVREAIQMVMTEEREHPYRDRPDPEYLQPSSSAWTMAKLIFTTS